MKKICRKVLSLVLAAVLCVSLLPVNSALAYGDAMSTESVKKLLNAEELHPQRTGYPEIDGMLEKIIAPYKGADTYTKIKAMYDWAVNNIVYSWDGYSQNYAPAYDCFTLKYDLEYETGLPQAYPMDMIYRAYHALTAKKGVCYDWAILFTVMARYVGIESYVRTGILTIGTWRGHHGWTELRLGGTGYIFDSQQDNRSKGLVGWIVYDHFGIAPDHAGRFAPETAVNAARDKLLLSLTAPRVRVATVGIKASRSGDVSGAGTYEWGSEVTLEAVEGSPAVTWYTPNGQVLGNRSSYSFCLEGNTEIYALFEGDRFVDVPASGWYVNDVLEAANRGYVSGMTTLTFQAGDSLTRAMLVALLARVDGADLTQSPDCVFKDVDQQSWYADAVNWAYENDLAYGITEESFGPSQKVTREQAAVMMTRYLRKKGLSVTEGSSSFTDADEISSYAREDIDAASAIGILSGYQDGTVRPKDAVTRAESACMLMRMVRCLEAA